MYECKLKGILKVKNDKLNCIVGDIVEFNEIDKTINKVYERENFLDRPLISNIDFLGITFSIKSPDFDFTNFQKILLNVYHKNITPLLILTKTDLVSEEVLDTFLKKFHLSFKALDIKVFALNFEDDNSVNLLKSFIAGKIVAFSGPSGVGKSTLINKILDEDVLKIGDISEKTERGKHTTTESRFFELDSSTIIVDTPGFSTLDFPKLKVKKELEYLFPDFELYSKSCKFRNCTHIIEPNCGVRKALEEELIPELRYSFYLYSFNNIF